MDFLNMNFHKLFMKKHGKKVFNQIKDQITQEANKHITEEYIEIVFKIACLSFWGLSKSSVKQIIKDVFPNQQLNIEKMQNIHKYSINTIQRYLHKAIL